MSFWVVKKNTETQVEVESPYLEVVLETFLFKLGKSCFSKKATFQ